MYSLSVFLGGDLLNTLFLKAFILFQSCSRFTRLKESYRDFSHTLCPHTHHTLPSVIIFVLNFTSMHVCVVH